MIGYGRTPMVWYGGWWMQFWLQSNELNARTIGRVQRDLLHVVFQVIRVEETVQARSRKDGRQRQASPGPLDHHPRCKKIPPRLGRDGRDRGHDRETFFVFFLSR